MLAIGIRYDIENSLGVQLMKILGVKDDLLLLDLTKAFKDGKAQLLVMALMERGAYTDEEGYQSFKYELYNVHHKIVTRI